MVIAFQILIVILAVCLVFVIAPTAVIFRSIFFRRMEEGRAVMNAYTQPYASLLDEAGAAVSRLPFSSVSIRSFDGLSLVSDYYDAGSDKTAILFHGYHSSPYHNCLYQAALFAERGYNLLMVHMRGHGKSEGGFCTMGYREKHDVLDWVAYASRDASVKHIVLYGVSMGASSVAYASDMLPTDKVRAMVLDCGFFGIREQMVSDAKKTHAPHRLILPFIRLYFRIRFGGDIRITTAEALKNAKAPALVIHGSGDHTVPFSHGEAVYAACASEKEALFIPDAEHTCALMKGGEDAKRALFSFLDRNINQNHI